MAPTAPFQALPPLLHWVEAFAKRRILVVGDLVADHYIYGQTDRVSREAPVLVVRYETAEVKLGGGANAAANARSLGGQVSVVGLLGRDEMAQELRRLFKDSGIRVRAVSAPGIETETKTRILAGGLNTSRQQMLRLDRGHRGPLPASLRAALAKQLTEAAQGVDAVLVSDYGAGVLNRETRTALRKLAADGQTVCVDSRYALSELQGVTVCKPNEPELEALTGLLIRSERDLIEAGRAAMAKLKCRSLVVTRGRNGMAVFDAQGDVELLPVHGSKEAVDVTGAGDTVIAAFSLGLAAGASALEAARIANVAGSIVVRREGTVALTRAELLAELRSVKP
jgi:rfaE bifunctional protein kinase chain/domain